MNLISGFVNSYGTNIHYYKTMNSLSPLVLAHGITDDGLCWFPVAEKLSGKYEIVMADARGHGKSEAPENGYSLQNLARELEGVIQHLEIDAPILLGHSMGAITTLLLAGMFPDLPKAILLEDPPPFWNQSSQFTSEENDMSAGFFSWMNSFKRKTRDELLEEGKSENPNWSMIELEKWVDAKHRFSIQAKNLFHPEDINTINYEELFRKIKCPVLYMIADQKYGAISSQDDVNQLRNWIPQLQSAMIENAGHSIRRDQFETYMAVINKFLLSL